MKKFSRSLLAGALLLGGLVVGGGARIAQAACASGQVTFSGTVTNAPINTTVHLSAGDPDSESGWTDFDLATVDWANLFTFAASEDQMTSEDAASYTTLMEAQNFTDTITSGAYEICVADEALTLVATLMMMMDDGGGNQGGGQGGGGQGGGGTTSAAAEHLHTLDGTDPSFGYQIIAVPSLSSWTPGATAPSLGATPSEIKSADDCSSSCTFTSFTMTAPTIWGQDVTGVATDVYLSDWGMGGGRALADIPTVVGGGISKFAAAFTFQDESPYNIVGGSFIETSFARAITSSASGAIGYVSNGNLSGQVVDADGNALEGVEASVEAEVYTGDEGTHPQTGSGIADFWDNGQGLFFGNIAAGETYMITAEVSGSPDSLCYVTNTGGVLAIATEPTSSGCESIADSDADGIYELELSLGDATAPFVVKNSSGEVVGRTSVGVGANSYGWFQDDWSETGEDGVVGWSPTVGGYWRISLASPTDDVAEDDPQYLFTVYFAQVAINEMTGGVSINQLCTGWDYSGFGLATGCDGTPLERTDAGPDGDITTTEDNRFVFVLPEFDPTEPDNISVTVTNNGEPVHRSRLRVEQLNSGGWYQYLYETDTNNLGVLAFALAPGKYKLTANPAWNDDSGMAAADIVICMTADGPTDCSGTALSEYISIALASPNVVGTAWLDEIGGDVARYAWGNVESYNSTFNFWQYIGNLSTDDEGAFRIALSPSTRPYKLNIEPPWGSTGLSRAKVFVLVEDEGVCVVANENVTSCGGDFDTQIDIVYPAPNFSGTVTAGGSGTRAYLQGEVWNGNWWQWGNVWAQTNLSGSFAMNLEANPAPGDSGTFYKIGANPHDWTSGYSRTEKIVEMRDVDSDGSLDWCLTEMSAFGIPEDCVDDDFAVDGEDFDIALRGANFVGLATDSFDVALANAYVEVVLPSTFGGWTWLTSAQTASTGVFRMVIELNRSDWTEIEVRVNPPWGGSAILVKEARSYWVGDEDGDGVASDICSVDPGVGTDCEVAGGELVNADEEEVFALSGGNLNGTITDPTTDEGAPFIQVQVEKMVEQDWDNDGDQDSTWYQWMNLWGQSNAEGQYSVQVEDNVFTWGTDLVEGTYRVTATPWGRSDVAAKSVEFCIVDEDDDGAPVDPEVDADCDEDADGSETVDITLAEPNVQGVVETGSGAAVPNAWVALEQKYSYDWDGNGVDDWVWWSYTGRGGQTNSDGEFSMFMDVTATMETYRIAVNPPWNWAGDPLVRFNSDEFDFVDGGVESVDFSGDDALVFPSPKLQLTIVDQDGDAVPQSWVQVEKLQFVDWNLDGVDDWSWWQWQDSYGGANFNGEVALNPTNLDVEESELDDELDEWRVVVNPPWNSTSNDLPRFETLLSELDDTDAEAGSITAELAYPEPNFAGTVYATGEAAGSEVTTMRWGWIQIDSFDWNDNDTPLDSSDDFMQNFQWVAGGNTNDDGDFSMRVSDGDGAEDSYLVRFYSNGWGTWSPPVEAIVTFDETDQLTSWVYRIDTGDEQCDDGPGCSVDVYFDHIPPNVHLTIAETDAPITTGKAWVKFISVLDGTETSLTGASDGTSIELSGLLSASGEYAVRVTYKDDSDNVTCREYDYSVDISGDGFEATLDLADGADCV